MVVVEKEMGDGWWGISRRFWVLLENRGGGITGGGLGSLDFGNEAKNFPQEITFLVHAICKQSLSPPSQRLSSLFFSFLFFSSPFLWYKQAPSSTYLILFFFIPSNYSFICSLISFIYIQIHFLTLISNS